VPQNISTCRVSLSEASIQTNIPTRTLRRHIKEGRLPAVRVGPKVMKVDIEDVKALIQPVGAEADTLESRVKALVAQAPPLTDEQRDRIAGLFRAGAAA
jgi:excisionase family DNA binding protein